MDEQVRRLRRSSESGRPLGGVVIFKLSALACAAALAVGVAPAAASDVDFHWDGRQFVTADGGFSLRPKGRLLLDASTTDGSAFAARNVVGDEVRALRFGVEGMVGEHLFYTAEVLSEQLNPGPETIEAQFFREEDIPWDEIAFRTVSTTLQHWFADRAAGRIATDPAQETTQPHTVHCIDLV